MQRLLLILTGLTATALAVAGAILPGLPTTPFLLIALWAFARSSRRLYDILEKIPILRSALDEAHRFEKNRAIRLSIKIFAVSIAWGSVLFTAYLTNSDRPYLLGSVIFAALAASLFMWWIPTERGEQLISEKEPTEK